MQSVRQKNLEKPLQELKAFDLYVEFCILYIYNSVT